MGRAVSRFDRWLRRVIEWVDLKRELAYGKGMQHRGWKFGYDEAKRDGVAR